MGAIGKPLPVKLFCGIIAADVDVLDAAEALLEGEIGSIGHASDVVPFDFTSYYEEEMGAPLLRKFVSFRQLVDPGELADIKLRTIALEGQLSVTHAAGRIRRVNLDPGYITAAKLVLATTKNFAHRVYIGRGIYAEVTLGFRKNGFVFYDWTYPDFRSEAYREFFMDVRRRFIARQKSS